MSGSTEWLSPFIQRELQANGLGSQSKLQEASLDWRTDYPASSDLMIHITHVVLGAMFVNLLHGHTRHSDRCVLHDENLSSSLATNSRNV